MATLNADFELATTGTALTTSNQGAGVDVLQISLVGTGTLQATTTTPIFQTKSAVFSSPAATDTVTFYWNTTGAPQTGSARGSFYLAAAPGGSAAQNFQLLEFYSGGVMMSIGIRQDGRIIISDATGAVIKDSVTNGPGVLTFPKTITIDAILDAGTSITTGKTTINIYDHSTSLVTPWWSIAEITGQNFWQAGAGIASYRFGKIGTSLTIANWEADGLRAVDSSYALQGIWSLPSLPISSIIDSTGWAALNGTTILSNISDTDSATGVTSSAGPSNQLLKLQLPGLTVPSTDFIVALEGFRGGGATTGTIVGYLYEGATLRATSNTQSLGASNAPFSLTFLFANLSSITPGGWSTGLQLWLSVSAS